MLDNNIVLWSIRNKTSEKIVRRHHSKGVILITPLGVAWKEKNSNFTKTTTVWGKNEMQHKQGHKKQQSCV